MFRNTDATVHGVSGELPVIDAGKKKLVCNWDFFILARRLFSWKIDR